MPRQLAYRTSLVAVVSAAVIVGASTAAPARDSATVVRGDVAPYTTTRAGVVADAGVTGKAMIVTPAGSDHSIVRIRAQGLEPGQNYGVHIHFGACRQYQGHFQYQSPGPVTRDNEIWLDLQANAAGRARDQVKVPRLDDEGPLSIVIHALSNPDLAPGQPGHPGARIACANLDAHS